MKKILMASIMLIAVLALRAEDKKMTGMPLKKYWMVMLKKGTERAQNDSTAKLIQKGHLEHMDKMANEKKLVMAGPMGDDGSVRGICIYDVETEEEVRKYCEADPAVQAKRLSYEIHPWYAQPGSCLP